MSFCHLSDRKCNSDTKLMRNSERNTEIGFKNVDKNRIREQYKPASINLGLLLRGEKVNCSKKKVNWVYTKSNRTPLPPR